MRLFSLLVAGAIFGVGSVFYGDGLGLSGPVVFVGSVIGSMAGVAVNLVGARWLADRLRARAEAKGEESRVDRIARRAGPLVDQLGTVGLGLVGPVVFGTFGAPLSLPLSGFHVEGRFLRFSSVCASGASSSSFSWSCSPRLL